MPTHANHRRAFVYPPQLRPSPSAHPTEFIPEYALDPVPSPSQFSRMLRQREINNVRPVPGIESLPPLGRQQVVNATPILSAIGTRCATQRIRPAVTAKRRVTIRTPQPFLKSINRSRIWRNRNLARL